MMRFVGDFSWQCVLFMALCAIIVSRTNHAGAINVSKMYNDVHPVTPIAPVDNEELARMKLLDALTNKKAGILGAKGEADEPLVKDEEPLGHSPEPVVQSVIPVEPSGALLPADDMHHVQHTTVHHPQVVASHEYEQDGVNNETGHTFNSVGHDTAGQNHDAAEHNHDNLRALEQSIGLNGFFKPFIENLDDKVREALVGTASTNYVDLYKRYSLRLDSLEKQARHKVVSLVETNNDSLGLIDFKEKEQDYEKPEAEKEALKITEITSMLELGEVRSPNNIIVTRTPSQIPARRSEIQVSIRNKEINEKPQPTWKETQRVVEALLVKVLYLLGGDSKTTGLRERLSHMAKALGYDRGGEKSRQDSSNTPLSVATGMEMFNVCGNNPFLLGHLATNMLAFNEYEDYFGRSNGKPFYSWLKLVTSGDINMLDRMCGVKRGPRFKKSSSGKVVPNSNRTRLDDTNMKPDSIFLCNVLEVLMIAINNSIDSMGVLLKQYGMPYEPNVGLVNNGIRMQLFLCSDPRDSAIMTRCDFKSSLLAKANIYEGKSQEEAKELYRNLHEAFDLFKLLGEVEMDGEASHTWVGMLSDPRRYESILENAIKFDRRMFSGKGKTWEKGYKSIERAYLGEQNAVGSLHVSMALSLLKGETAAVVKDLKGFKRPLVYMSASGMKVWVVNNLLKLQQRFGFSPSALLSGNLAPYFKQVYNSVSSGLSHIFLYYMLTTKAPAYHLQNEISKFRGGNVLYNIVESSNMFIPKSLKKGIKWLLRGGLGREFQREKAKHQLLRLLPMQLLKKAINCITFVTHSLADLQINQNAAEWGKALLSKKERHAKHFTKGGYMNYVDGVIREWSDEGYTDAMARRLKNGEEMTKEDLKHADMHTIKHTESLKWDKHLNSLVLDGYTRFLNLDSIKTLEGKQSLLYEIVKDSRDNLEQNLSNTVFFGRVIPPAVYNNKWKRMIKRATNVGKMIFNKSLQKVEHAVWFGVKLDYKGVVEVVEQLNNISTLLSPTESYSLQEAFGHIIDDAVAIVSNQEFRHPQGAQDNFGIPSINPMYVRMAPDERKLEFQQGMCGQHCGAIWRALLAFTMNTMRSPASIKTFERTLSQNGSLKDMDKPEFINSMRFILKGDALVHMYDSMLPKKMKRELRAIKYGKAFYFANIMKMASNLLGLMGYKYTSHMLHIQAPYLGNFVVQWDREREKSKSKAIFSYLSLGTMATYSMLQCAEITQHATDIGQSPVESCFTILKPPKVHCISQPLQAVATSALSVGIQDTFSVTVMAVIGPYFFLPMAAHASWQILKHHFKIIHRLDIALSATFRRMWNKITSFSSSTKLGEWFSKRREHRKAIEQEGLMAMKSNKTPSKDIMLHGSAVHDELLQDEDIVSYTTFD